MSRTPFAHLLAPPPARLPKSSSITFVVAGQNIGNAYQLNAAAANDEIDPERLEELKRELRAAKARARYQRDRLDPVKVAKRKAYYEANREHLLAWKREYSKTHRAEIQKAQTAWMRRKYREDPSRHLEACKRYYQRHRDKVLARGKTQRDAARAARDATTAAGR